MNIGSTHAINGKFDCEALSVVCAQFGPISATTMDDVNKNVDTIIEYMDRAACGFPGVDLFVSMECALQGFHPTEWSNVLVDLDGPQIQRLRDKCKELKMWGVFNPLVRQEDGKAGANMAIIVNDKGEIVHKYVKMNPWIPGEASYPGWECPVTPGPKGSRLATIICADGDYPEIWREAAFNGANVIIRVSHYMAPWDRAWEITNRAGAYFNQCYVVTANSVGIDEAYTYFGRSMIVNPDGTIIVEAPMGLPWLIKADIYPQIVDQIRRKSVTSNFMYAFKHRGGSCKDFDGVGDIECRYNAYKDWKKDPILP
jgi:amidase/formamidase